MINADGTNLRNLTNNNDGDWGAAWSPDSRSIAFYSNRDGDGGDEIYVMNADGSNQRRLTNNSASDVDPAWSPDGRFIAFGYYRDDTSDIYVMNADGTNQRNLTNNSDSDGHPTWSPDGRSIAFHSYLFDDAQIEIYVMDLQVSGGGQDSGADLVVGIDPIGIRHLSLMPGESFVFWIGVHNQGTGPSGATTLRYYQSDDATISNSDTQLGSTQVGGLEASDSSGERVTFTAPSSVGTYYYGACVESVSGESNTNNNCSGEQVTVTGGGVSQREALVALYNATGGPNWTNNTNWLTDNDISTWYGVEVSDGSVTALHLRDNNLTGEISAELGNLSNLTELYLYGNQLTSGIPVELGNLTNITQLWLGHNQLSGQIPTELGNLTNLIALHLNNNQLSGQIPTELGNLTNITQLGLGGNQLRGQIPTELGNLTNITQLWLGHNQLSGQIPVALTRLTNLTHLTLNHNQLSGEIPSELGNLTNLEWLYLYDNTSLTGALPQSLTRLTKLNQFLFDNTGLYAPPDAAFQAWLQGIANHSGPTYAPSGQREALVALYNATDGDNWTNNDNWLSDNDISSWYGVGVSDGSVTELNLDENNLTGEIPAELGNLTNLGHLGLTQNALTGEIPPELGNLSKLEVLKLDGNALSGSIPSELGNLTNLGYLGLDRNALSGEIPPELGNLSKLEVLKLDGNALSGEIPSELGNLTNLKELNLWGNPLTGALPQSLTMLTMLENFHFGGGGLCAPSDAAFQAWLQGIEDHNGPTCSETVSSRILEILGVKEQTYRFTNNGPVMANTTTDDDYFPTWSPDGRYIAITSGHVTFPGSSSDVTAPGSSEVTSEIYREGHPIGGSFRLTKSIFFRYNEEPAWSPDSRSIAFAANRFDQDNWDIYTVDFYGNNLRRLTNSSAIDRHPSWSPDGRYIAFSSFGDIYVMNADGRNPRRLTYNGATDPSWSPDSRSIAFSRPAGIYVMNADGSNQRKLTNYPGDYHPAWSPDSRYIAFSSTRDGNYEIYVMNADGSNQRNLTNHPVHDYHPAWSPDGRYIAFTTSYRQVTIFDIITQYEIEIMELEIRWR